ncbi:MAG: hypothetical protein P4M08_11110 [Oligoflexia bacterium]|nr:hypothetical protein [Oligoflexia bacterium]
MQKKKKVPRKAARADAKKPRKSKQSVCARNCAPQYAAKFSGEERAFLHSLATPLSILALQIEMIDGPQDQLHKTLERIYTLIRERRKILFGRAEAETKS